jgi:large subunit ribosomal protein L9
MKIILLDDVRGVGMRGQKAEVADGYARNFLIPNRKALRATPAAIRRAEEHDQNLARKEAGVRAEAETKSKAFEGIKLTIKVKADDDRLYGSVGAAEIIAALEEKKIGVPVEKKDVMLRSPIKSVGTYSVPVQLFRDIQPLIEVEVLSDAPPKKAEPKPKPVVVEAEADADAATEGEDASPESPDVDAESDTAE